MVAAAVVFGLLLPVGAFAAGSLVEISSPSGRKAQVTKAAQLQTALASPETFVRSRGYADGDTCRQIIAAPAQRGLVITDVHMDVYRVVSPGQGTAVMMSVQSTCEFPIFWHNPSELGMTALPFASGLAVPAGGGLYAKAVGDVGVEFYTYGYKVPAEAVPAAPLARAGLRAATETGPGTP
jgi:hypothetical protein